MGEMVKTDKRLRIAVEEEKREDCRKKSQETQEDLILLDIDNTG